MYIYNIYIYIYIIYILTLIIPYSNILSLKEVDKPMSTEMVEYLVELFKVEI